jgi:hypothetical protein
VRSLGPGARGALVVVRCAVMARGRSWCARWDLVRVVRSLWSVAL